MAQSLHQQVLEALPELVRRVDGIALRYKNMWDEVKTRDSMPVELSHAMEHAHYEPVEVSNIRSLLVLYRSVLESGRNLGQRSEVLEAVNGVIAAFPSPKLTEDGYSPEVVAQLRTAVSTFLAMEGRFSKEAEARTPRTGAGTAVPEFTGGQHLDACGAPKSCKIRKGWAQIKDACKSANYGFDIKTLRRHRNEKRDNPFGKRAGKVFVWDCALQAWLSREFGTITGRTGKSK